MASSQEFVEYVCDQLAGAGVLHYRKMFGDYMIYLNAKPAVLVCDNVPYVKKLAVIKEMMAAAEVGFPYPGAKEHYVLAIEDRDFCCGLLREIEPYLTLPRAKKRKAQK